MLRRPKNSKNEVVASKEEEEAVTYTSDKISASFFSRVLKALSFINDVVKTPI
jgi:hypothetical protein